MQTCYFKGSKIYQDRDLEKHRLALYWNHLYSSPLQAYGA